MLQNNNEKEWFEEWFDSPYYHILYKDRDNKEAQQFITNLITYLKPSKIDFFLDVACGKGRHSIFIDQLGYQVDAFDLSENSIAIAKNQANKNIKFYVNDIRTPLKLNHYNFVLNLFTSFGYFEEESDNQLAINAMAKSLKQGGILVLDFMNCNKVVKKLEKQEIKRVDNICFNISKSFNNGFILKNIDFVVKGNVYSFQEKVKALNLNQFKHYFNTANLKIEGIFGDYCLNDFDEDNSERLIIVAKK